MEFKIDTKETYSVIRPITDSINAKMTDLLDKTCADVRQNGSSNLIVDLQDCKDADAEGLEKLVNMHEESYANDHSMVFTAVTPGVMKMLKANETDLLINVAPTMAEAVDIVSMEILERDLFNEE